MSELERAITREQVIAAMKAVEEDTIRRCADLCAAYASSRGDGTGRIAQAKKNAAYDIRRRITEIPRKSE